MREWLAVVGVALLMAGPAEAQLGVVDGPLSVIQGPVEADVLRVIDSDTYDFVAYPFPEQATWGQLRLDGIDSPEKYGRCVYETALSAKATEFVTNLFKSTSGRVNLYVIGLRGSHGGSFGRYRAQVKINGQWLSDLMIKEGLAREYHGGKRLPWCPAP